MNSYDSLFAPWNQSGQQTRASLLKRMSAKEIDEMAWTDFFRKYRPFVVMLGRKPLNLTRSEIKDLMSNVFSEISRKGIEAYHPENGQFRAWFKSIVLNRGRDIIRKRTQNKKYVTDDFSFRSEEDTSEQEDEFETVWKNMLLYSILQDMKEELNPTHFQVFFLVCLQGRKVKDAAYVSNLKENTATKIISRIKDNFYQRFLAMRKEYPLDSLSENELMEHEKQLHLQYRAIEKEYSGLLE